jgi:DNA-binding MarR family transcriptional regulator
MIAEVDDGVTQPRPADETTALLIAQVGTQIAYRYARKLRELDLLPSHVGILKLIGTNTRLSQRALGRRLCILPNRVLVLINELAEKGLVERRGKPLDRRAYALRLTASGHQMLAVIRELAPVQDEQICGGLSRRERNRLAALLCRVAVRLKLTPGIDAGYRRLVSRSRSRKQRTSTAKLGTGS